MENKLTEKELKESMVDVRLAYRLLYEHQSRILTLVEYIKDAFGMKEQGGNKFFSHTMRSKRNDYSEVWVTDGMWAWDFFYSYCFEFYLGCLDTEDKKKRYSMSVVEVCDTGFWDSSDANRVATNITTFAPVEESSSCLVFVIESIDTKKKNDYWIDRTKLGEELYKFLYSKEKTYIFEPTESNYFILARYDMSSFLNQSTTDKVLKDFNNLIMEKTDISLLVRDV